MDAFLRQHGWRRVGDEKLDVTGIILAGRYRGETCSAEVRVLLLDPTGDMQGIARDLTSDADRLFFVQDGAASKVPPLYAPFRQALGRVVQSLRLPLFHVPPYLAVAAPEECDRIQWACAKIHVRSFLFPVDVSDAGMRGGGRPLSDG